MSARTCPVKVYEDETCPVTLEQGHLMCLDHWRRVPTDLQQEIYAALREGGVLSDRYETARNMALAAVGWSPTPRLESRGLKGGELVKLIEAPEQALSGFVGWTFAIVTLYRGAPQMKLATKVHGRMVELVMPLTDCKYLIQMPGNAQEGPPR